MFVELDRGRGPVTTSSFFSDLEHVKKRNACNTLHCDYSLGSVVQQNARMPSILLTTQLNT